MSMQNVKPNCILCGNVYKNKFQLRKHLRNVHKVKQELRNIFCSEEGCEQSFCSISNFRDHLAIDHQVRHANEYVVLRLPSEEDFEQWLMEEEMKTSASFVLARGKRRNKDHSVIKYQCNRSGVYKPGGCGKRQMRSSGSIKIGFHCTAGITAKIFETYVEVTYYRQHYKHDSVFRSFISPRKENILELQKLADSDCSDVESVINDCTLSDLKETSCQDNTENENTAVTGKELIMEKLDYLTDLTERQKVVDDKVAAEVMNHLNIVSNLLKNVCNSYVSVQTATNSPVISNPGATLLCEDGVQIPDFEMTQGQVEEIGKTELYYIPESDPFTKVDHNYV